MKWLLGLLGIGGLIFLMTRKAEAQPTYTPYVPTVEEILATESTAELDAYYNLINELYITQEIDEATYNTLYSAYSSKFTELTEV